MKSIRLFFAAFALPLALALAGCSKEYDDTELRNKISSLESRIAELESLKTTMSGIQTTVANLEKKLSVTAVKTDPANGNVTISFSDGSTATLTSGKVVSVKEIDGVLYWAIDGEVVKDPSGTPIPVTDEDNIDFRVATDGTLEYTLDGGKTWIPVKGTADEPGILVSETDESYIVEFADGSTFVLPKLLPFSLQVQLPESLVIAKGKTLELPYTVTGVASDDTVELGVIGATEGLEVNFAATTNATGSILVTNKSVEKGEVALVLYATNHSGQSDICSLSFTAEGSNEPVQPGDSGYSACLGSWTSAAGTLVLAEYPEVENAYQFAYSGFGDVTIPAVYSQEKDAICFGTSEIGTNGNWTYYFVAFDSDDYIEMGGPEGDEFLAFGQVKDGVLTIVGNEYDAVYEGKTYHEVIVSLSILGYLSKKEGTNDVGWYSFQDVTPMALPATFNASAVTGGAPVRLDAARLVSGKKPVPAQFKVR